MSNARSTHFSGWDCAQCGLPLSLREVEAGSCTFCRSTAKVVSDCEED